MWYVVYTQINKEEYALQQLQQQGWKVYCPKFLKKIRHARKQQEVTRPLFPRYLFVQESIGSGWRPLSGTRGVQQLLMHSLTKPASISDDIVMALQEQENPNGFVPLKALEFFYGEKVRLTNGVFQDYSAIFEKYTDQQRVELLIEFMGRQTRIKVSPEIIEKIT